MRLDAGRRRLRLQRDDGERGGYQRDLNPNVPREAVERFARERLRSPGLEGFCLRLYDGVAANGPAMYWPKSIARMPSSAPVTPHLPVR